MRKEQFTTSRHRESGKERFHTKAVDFRATVGLTTNVGIKQDLTLTTDANGSFSAELPSGLFTMFWSRPPPSRRIVGRFDLTPGQTATFNAKLSVSLIV